MYSLTVFYLYSIVLKGSGFRVSGWKRTVKVSWHPEIFWDGLPPATNTVGDASPANPIQQDSAGSPHKPSTAKKILVSASGWPVLVPYYGSCLEYRKFGVGSNFLS